MQPHRRQFSSSSSSEEEFYSLEKKELPRAQQPEELPEGEYMPEESELEQEHDVLRDAHMPVYSFSQSKSFGGCEFVL